jgi:endonuclease/exonuclease/phosphatase family metal-dependent hydrolase
VSALRPTPFPRVLVLLLGLALGACANARNLTDPGAPRFGTSGRTERTALATGTPERLTVVTFNIKYGRRVDLAIEVLRSPALRIADIIALQEVDEHDVERIASALRLEYVYYPASVHPVEGRHFGSAILSAWPIERDWKVLLPHYSWGRRQQRTGTGAVLRLGDARVRVYSVHLEVPVSLTPGRRREQVERLLCDAGDAREPIVVAGDFNGPDVAYLFERQGYTWPTRGLGPTAALFSADHVFVRDLAPLEAGLVEDTRGASDHKPVWTTVALSGPPRPAAAPPAFCRD